MGMGYQSTRLLTIPWLVRTASFINNKNSPVIQTGLIVISTLSADPWADAFSLFNASHASQGLKKSFVDPNVPRMYLLLHDAVKASHVK
jgi:hypothetical protein